MRDFHAFAAGLLAAASATAQTYSIIKTFAGGTNDGAHPDAGLALSDGVLYGTTTSGDTSNFGTLFKVSTNGSGYAVLTNFQLEAWGFSRCRPGIMGGLARHG